MKLEPVEFLYLLQTINVDLADPINAKIIKIYYTSDIDVLKDILHPHFLNKLVELLTTLNIPITIELKAKIMNTVIKIIEAKPIPSHDPSFPYSRKYTKQHD